MKRTLIRYETKTDRTDENQQLIEAVFKADLDAFRSFQGGIRDRTVEPPQSSGATVIGNYRMLSE